MTRTSGTLESDFDTTAVRAIAALLIINSHCERLYPAAWMADGGQLGIATFFLVAGLGTALSGKTRSLSFGRWYSLRLSRIYPSIWIVVVAFSYLLFDGYREWSAPDYFARLIYPIEGYTFFVQIIPFYALGFAVVRWGNARGIALLLLVNGLVSLGLALPDAMRLFPSGHLQLGNIAPTFWWFWYFEIYLFGIWMGTVRPPTLASRRLAWSSLVFLSLAYVGLKFAMVVQGRFAYLYPLLWLVVVAWVVLIVDCFRDEQAMAALRSQAKLAWTLALIGGLSLETFLVHEQLLRFDWLVATTFPLNVLTLILLTIAISWVVSRVSKISQLHFGGR